MTKDEALDLALEALENTYALRDAVVEAITAIKQARSAPVQSAERVEPMAWVDVDENGTMYSLRYWSEPDNRNEVALYRSPPNVATPQPAPVQEPVAWCVLEPWLSGKFEAQDCFSDVALDANVGWVPLYTTPPAAQPAPVQESEKRECMNCAAFGECNPNNDAGRCGYEPPAAQRQWVGLTDEDIEQEFGFIDELLRDCVHRTEAKLKAKNSL